MSHSSEICFVFSNETSLLESKRIYTPTKPHTHEGYYIECNALMGINGKLIHQLIVSILFLGIYKQKYLLELW